jgi:hypothetical protein
MSGLISQGVGAADWADAAVVMATSAVAIKRVLVETGLILLAPQPGSLTLRPINFEQITNTDIASARCASQAHRL